MAEITLRTPSTTPPPSIYLHIHLPPSISLYLPLPPHPSTCLHLPLPPSISLYLHIHLPASTSLYLPPPPSTSTSIYLPPPPSTSLPSSPRPPPPLTTRKKSAGAGRAPLWPRSGRGWGRQGRHCPVALYRGYRCGQSGAASNAPRSTTKCAYVHSTHHAGHYNGQLTNSVQSMTLW